MKSFRWNWTSSTNLKVENSKDNEINKEKKKRMNVLFLWEKKNISLKIVD